MRLAPRPPSRFEAMLEASCLDKKLQSGPRFLEERRIDCGGEGGTQASTDQPEQHRVCIDFQPTDLPPGTRKFVEQLAQGFRRAFEPRENGETILIFQNY